MSSVVSFSKCFRQSGGSTRHRNRMADSAVTAVSAGSFGRTSVQWGSRQKRDHTHKPGRGDEEILVTLPNRIQ
jgi:hypothetical protein